MKFENLRTAFRKFGKFEKQSFKFWNIQKIGREQMNEQMNKRMGASFYLVVAIYLAIHGR